MAGVRAEEPAVAGSVHGSAAKSFALVKASKRFCTSALTVTAYRCPLRQAQPRVASICSRMLRAEPRQSRERFVTVLRKTRFGRLSTIEHNGIPLASWPTISLIKKRSPR